MGSKTGASQTRRPDDQISQQAAARAEIGTDALRWRRVFEGEERQLGAMRRWLMSLLPDCPARDDVLSVANELGSNAILHTASGQGAWFAVEVTWFRSVVQVAVADCGGPGEPQMIDDPDGERGRGLLLVKALSVRTGFVGDQRGRLAWAQIAWTDPDGTAPAPPQDPYRAAIRDGEAALARRFAAVPAWFGRSTLRWWALPGSGGLVSAPSAPELATLLYQLEQTAGSPPRDVIGHPHRATDEEPGLPPAQEQGFPSRRPRRDTRLCPGSATSNRLKGRDQWPNRHRGPDGIFCWAWVLSGSSRFLFDLAALASYAV